jgi:hypothetical protein
MSCCLFQLNTRVYLTSLTQELKLVDRRAMLDDIPDSFVDELRDLGFESVYFLSVWKISEASGKLSKETLKAELEASQPGLKDDDIGGSGFAIDEYVVDASLGGPEALRRFRERLRQRKLKLILDFVPNHMGLSNCWLTAHPDFFVLGNDNDLRIHPSNWTRTATDHVMAFGKDTYFTWRDTLQLNYANPGGF